MENLAKILIIVGIMFVVSGLALFVLGKIPGIGKLPGDIIVKKDNFTFYFPIMTCIMVSIILSLILMLWQKK